MQSYKWHYFNMKDDMCRFKHPFTPDIILLTYCNKHAMNVRRHTEFKSNVTCVQCLRRLNATNTNEA